jgi:hypothetical protein
MHFILLAVLICGPSRCCLSWGSITDWVLTFRNGLGGPAIWSYFLKNNCWKQREDEDAVFTLTGKNCIVACVNVRGYGQVGKQNMIGRMIIHKRFDICMCFE